jgi:hypothetical protein
MKALEEIEKDMVTADEERLPNEQRLAAIAHAGIVACRALRALLGDQALWEELRRQYEAPERRHNADRLQDQRFTDACVPVTAELLVRLYYEPPEDAIWLVSTAQQLLTEVTSGRLEDSALVMETVRQAVRDAAATLEVLMEATCELAGRAQRRELTDLELRRFKSLLGRTTGVVGAVVATALQFAPLDQALVREWPDLISWIGQLSQAARINILALGPIMAREEAGWATTIIAAPAKWFAASPHLAASKWGPAGRTVITDQELANQLGSLRIQLAADQSLSSGPGDKWPGDQIPMPGGRDPGERIRGPVEPIDRWPGDQTTRGPGDREPGERIPGLGESGPGGRPF